jgi:hypothetical protein
MQQEAKVQSEAFLSANGIEINSALPFIEAPDELTPQTSTAVARRSLVLSYLAAVGFGMPIQKAKSALDEWALYDSTSADEKDLLAKPDLAPQEKINATWLPEAIQSLAWGLRLAEINHLSHCDDDLVTKFPLFANPAAFIDRATLRPFAEIYYQCDLLYRLHWAARNARVRGKKTDLNEGLIRERRKAMDWMVGVDPDWDNIPSDT